MIALEFVGVILYMMDVTSVVDQKRNMSVFVMKRIVL